MYKPGGTIRDALRKVEQNEYVLPAIQREFVWRPEQTARLFDSLMQGYPFGTFLFWTVEPANSAAYKFYGFVRDYHEKDSPHCPELGTIPDRSLIAVLDGQQRLTALNIALRGFMALKEPNKRRNNPNAYPKKFLHLNLQSDAQSGEDGVAFEFEFLELAKAVASNEKYWFRCGEILNMKSGPDMLSSLMSKGLSGEKLDTAFRNLDRLYRVIHTDPLISYYEESSQDLERVLNIFIRLNSGGTILSYSDLLLSIAVAQWSNLDARNEIHSLVDELNECGTGFNLSKDFVLKAGLMLTDIASVGFKVENFNRTNMEKLEKNWPKIRTSLLLTVQLAASFGLSGHTLRADSALLPIAYYLHGKGANDGYLTSVKYSKDREAIRGWLIRSLLKQSGIWGSGLDTLLTLLRATIQKSGYENFPAGDIYKAMIARGKSLTFESGEIDELVEMSYGDKRLFALLSLLYPFVDFRNVFHIDHVFPASAFSARRLATAGVSDSDAPSYIERSNLLPNLHLLEGPFNIEKRAKPPAEWLKATYKEEGAQKHYLEKHDLGDLPPDMTGFNKFYEDRKTRMRGRIEQLINVTLDDPT
jgi:hypothetical protein